MMRRIWNNLTSILLLPALFTCICLISCSQDTTTENQRSAYYWSTTWQMDSSKMNFIQKHHIKRLYVRFFDVVRDADGEIMPNATLQFETTDENMTAEEKESKSLMPKGMEIIPVVYIVNDCFKANTKTNPISSDKSGRKSSDETPRQLADKILNRILQMNEANDIENVKEIQIDCDWTASTKDAYFEFLHILKENAKDKKMQLSATIRLHQLSMTPPPVDRGILMMYNTGDVKQLSCQKPILDMKDAVSYTHLTLPTN